MRNYEYLLSNVTILNGVGEKTKRLLKKKNINKILDLLWRKPRDFIDATNEVKIKDLEIGKLQTVNVKVVKYNFPRLKNLPNIVLCEDDTGKLNCVFFNSYEGYIKKILPINETVTINGKINFYRKKYQITNPTNLSTDKHNIKKIHSKYNLTDGLVEKKYKNILAEVLNNLPDLSEWHDKEIISKFNNISWKKSILELHKPDNINKKGNFLKRLIFDEIFSSFLINSQIRKSIKKNKKKIKDFNKKKYLQIINRIGFNLTQDQLNAIEEINSDLKSNYKMFRLLQGDVGSGKTIVALIAAANVNSCKYQVAFMAPTEILAKQHFNLSKKIFNINTNIKLITGKTKIAEKRKILHDLKNGKIDIIFGTHSLFQENVIFKKLGLIIIDEQHKFGVKQRKNLSDKGGSQCDILVMSATPIPRTMIMTVYGDMDKTIIKQKPKNRIETSTYSKSENKIKDVINFVKKSINEENQVFWVCPLIDDSKIVDHQSTIRRYNELKKIFNDQVGLLHGLIDQNEKDLILNKFLNREIKILVSTTVIEVGIDFPNANVIIIENANKFGLSQLHQLRGRVGRGNKASTCILLYKDGLSENAKKRIKILKKTNNGFKIAEEDMRLRGYGDMLGFKQSGMKNFILADPIQNEDLFYLAEKEIKRIENTKNYSLKKYIPLLKLYDRADILNDIV